MFENNLHPLNKGCFWGFLAMLMVFSSCAPRLEVTRSVPAVVETKPVQDEGDAADDIAIYYHEADPAQSTIIGTDKTKGVQVYSLDGSQLYQYPLGRINNVDIRPGFELNGKKVHLLAGSNRTNNTLLLLAVNPKTRGLYEVALKPFPSQVDEVYGCCLYHSEAGTFYAFIVGKDGQVEQWKLFPKGDKVDAQVVRIFDVGGQCEGLVADDEAGFLYVGEENKAIWKYYADPDKGNGRILVDDFRQNRYLAKDIEGLTIYYAKNNKGYLLASSQGNNSYAVYEREGFNKYLGSFKIEGGAIDGTYDTDGIDVTNLQLNSTFPNGFFIAQDGANTDGEVEKTQNFKLVPWENIARQFSPRLIIDSSYRP